MELEGIDKLKEVIGLFLLFISYQQGIKREYYFITWLSLSQLDPKDKKG